MSNLNDIVKNYKYAPGIATYGAKGKIGIAGINGKSCFFCTYNINISEELNIVNRKIQSNELLSEYKELTLNREYQVNDIIIDNTGSIYKISTIDSSTNKLGINPETDKIGEFSKDSDSNYFKLSNSGRLYNQKGNGIDFIKSSQANPSELLDKNSQYVQRIYSDISDSESNYNLSSYVVQTNDEVKTLNTFYNKNDNSFHIECNAPIILDCSVLAVNDNDNSYEEIDNYSQVKSEKDNISKLYNLYKNVKYYFSSDYNILYLDTANFKELMNQAEFKPSEIFVYCKGSDDFSPIEKWALKLQWSDGTEYIIGDTLQYDISKLTTGIKKDLKVSILKNIEIFLSQK